MAMLEVFNHTHKLFNNFYPVSQEKTVFFQTNSKQSDKTSSEIIRQSKLSKISKIVRVTGAVHKDFES